MYRKVLFLGLFLGLLVQNLNAQDAPVRLSLQDAVAQALSNSPSLKQNRLTIDVATAQVEQAKVGNRPTLAFSTSVARGNEPSRIPVRGGDELLYVPGGSANQFQAQLSFSQPIYDFGKTEHGVTAARLAREAQESMVDRSASSLAFQVKAQYFRALYYTKLDSLYGQLIPFSEQLAEISRQRVEKGAALEPDVLRAQVEVQNARVDQAGARSEVKKAKSELVRLMGVESTQFELQEQVPVYLPPEDAARLVDPLVDQALQNRQDLQSLEFQSRQQAELARLADAQSRPTILLQSNLAYLGPKQLFGIDEPGIKTYSWRIGFNFAYPILDGRRNETQRQEAIAMEKQYQVQKDVLRQQIVADIRNNLEDLANLQTALEASNDLVAQAQASRDLVRIQHEKGAATLANYLESLSAVTSAEASREEIRYQIAQIVINLEHIVGAEISILPGTEK